MKEINWEMSGAMSGVNKVTYHIWCDVKSPIHDHNRSTLWVNYTHDF